MTRLIFFSKIDLSNVGARFSFLFFLSRETRKKVLKARYQVDMASEYILISVILIFSRSQ